MSYETVVVGTDGSETAQLAVRHAARFAAKSGGRLVIVTAYEPQDDEIAKQGRVPDDIRWMLTDKNLAEERAREGKEIAAAEGVSRVTVQALSGNPAEVLIDTAETFGANLIVVGSKGLSSPARFILGSVASDVSHHAPCDVFIAHTTD